MTNTKIAWAIDPVHSRIRFDAKYLLVTTVSGWFREFEGAVVNTKGDFSDGEIDIAIYTHSLYTGIEERDNHLRSADFFDTKKYPVIAFRSSSVSVQGKDIAVTGQLSVKDIKQELRFTAKYIGTVQDPEGNVKAAFEIDTVFDRKDFNISWNRFFDKEGILISDQVQLHCDIQLLKLS